MKPLDSDPPGAHAVLPPAPAVDLELEAALTSLDVDVVADTPRRRTTRPAAGTTPPPAILWPHDADEGA